LESDRRVKEWEGRKGWKGMRGKGDGKEKERGPPPYFVQRPRY